MHSLIIKLWALAHMTHLNAIKTAESGLECCELALEGRPDACAREVTNFINLQIEAGAIACQTGYEILSTHYVAAPEPSWVRPKQKAA